MTKREIAGRILALLEYDADEMAEAIFNLADEVSEDYYAGITDHDCYCD